MHLKDQKFLVTPSFYKALEHENDDSVLFHLRLFANMKITDRTRKFLKFHLYTNPIYWNRWRTQ